MFPKDEGEPSVTAAAEITAVTAPGCFCSMLMPSELGLPSQLVSSAPQQRLFVFSTRKHRRGSLFPLYALAQVCGISQSLIIDAANTFWPHFCSCWVQKPAAAGLCFLPQFHSNSHPTAEVGEGFEMWNFPCVVFSPQVLQTF